MRGSRLETGIVALAAAALAFGGAAIADVLPHDVKIEKVFTSTAEIADMAQAPTGELWILERAGTVRVLRDGNEVATLGVSVSTSCNAGLLDVAFPGDFSATGRALVSYVADSGEVRVDEVLLEGTTLSLGATVAVLGTTSSGCRPGGGMDVGKDGKIYVGVGDMDEPSSAQNDGSLQGKVLRMNADGSVPADNPSGTLIWAKGFRHGGDLAVNKGTARSEGSVYLSDLGVGSTAHDEINLVGEGGNFGWDVTTGSDGAGGYEDPLVDYLPVVGTRALEVGEKGSLGHLGDLFYACVDVDEIRLGEVSGAEGEVLDATATFFDPEADNDGTPDAGCPRGTHALTETGDGWLYAANDGDNAGVWRIWHDDPGPREVSAPGSPVPLTVERSGGDVEIGWELVPAIDAYFPARNGGQHASIYQVWEGSLPISAYDHAAVLQTDGAPDGEARLTATVTPGDGNRYFLVSAQGDNLEGSTGRSSAGEERNARTDYCDAIGYGRFIGECIDEFRHPDTGEPITLVDYNPNSSTYLEALSMADFRGKVVHLDISADNCFWCNVQADSYGPIDQTYEQRDFARLTVFTKSYQTLETYTEEECGPAIADWSNRHVEYGPVLCDVDLDGNGQGDVTRQFWHNSSEPEHPGEECGGTPQNTFIDQAGVIYDFSCGGTLGGTVETIILPEVNPETCE
jgi:hypothetical protein